MSYICKYLELFSKQVSERTPKLRKSARQGNCSAGGKEGVGNRKDRELKGSVTLRDRYNCNGEVTVRDR